MFKFIDSKDSDSGQSRIKTGMAVGIAGIAINTFIFGVELLSGILTGSMTLMADSFHNLVDAISSIIMVFSFKLAGKPADKKHPLGFGRIEYLCSLLVALLIAVIGISFIISSFEKILHPSTVQFSLTALLLMLFSIPLKLFYSILNHKLGRNIDSATLKAVSVEALSDVFVLAVAALSLIFARITSVHIDGYLGVAVSGFIVYSGYAIAKKSLTRLIGEAPDQAIVNAISAAFLDTKYVTGVHDLIIHDYGPQKTIASIHAEIPSYVPLIDAHQAVEKVEQKIANEMGIMVVTHVDPIPSCLNHDFLNSHHQTHHPANIAPPFPGRRNCAVPDWSMPPGARYSLQPLAIAAPARPPLSNAP